MNKITINLLTAFFLFSCGTKSKNNIGKDDKNLDSLIIIDKKYKLNDLKETDSFNHKLPNNRITDTLIYYLDKKTNIPNELFNEIFNYQLSTIDEAFLREIKKPFDSLIPVIINFKTIESDNEKEYIDLYIFNYNWKLLKSVSLEYNMDWDLYSQQYKFLNDSVFQVEESKGLSYDNDSTINRTLNIKFDKIKTLDTLYIKIDTLRYYE
ncbi:hypothetical protein ACOSP6_00365 [Tenacibaculum sp. MEBiC06402]|uniref:hypothetical protein n=1 Tax=unclassified Tenacibaculum TaxID=2635139 RepID=UPI003B998A3A